MNTNRTVIAVVAGVALIASAGVATASSATTEPPTASRRDTAAVSTDEGASAQPPVIDPGDGGNYAASIDPADFVDVVDNPYFPLTPGSRWVYEGESEGVAERIEVEVLDERRDIMGISAVVVRDTAYVDDEIVEDTYDWYAQDIDGNVWYLGEADPGIRRRRDERRRVVGVRRRWGAPRNRHAGRSRPSGTPTVRSTT